MSIPTTVYIPGEVFTRYETVTYTVTTTTTVMQVQTAVATVATTITTATATTPVVTTATIVLQDVSSVKSLLINRLNELIRYVQLYVSEYPSYWLPILNELNNLLRRVERASTVDELKEVERDVGRVEESLLPTKTVSDRAVIGDKVVENRYVSTSTGSDFQFYFRYSNIFFFMEPSGHRSIFQFYFRYSLVRIR